MAVDPARRLVDADLLDRGQLFEEPGKTGGPDGGIEHGRAAIGENGKAQSPALQLGETGRGIGEWSEAEIELHQLLMQQAILDAEQLHGVVEGIGGDLPEIGMDPHQAAQPGILQLLVAPLRGEAGRPVAEHAQFA